MTHEQAQGISDERLGELWRMPDNYMRPVSFARAVLALQEREDVAPLSEGQIATLWKTANTPCEDNDWTTGAVPFARAIEAAHGIRLLGEDAGRGES